jgi:hypothetical protein
MRKYIVEANASFRTGDISSFDPNAKGVQIMACDFEKKFNAIWKVETSLGLSQMMLLKNVIRVGCLFE